MSSVSSAGAKELLRHRPFLFYLASRGLSKFCYQIGAVAVGWQVYALTGSAFDLAVAGLVQFIPTALLTFVAGHVADRYNRKRVAQFSQFGAALAAAYLAWGSIAGWLTVQGIFAAVAVFGTAIGGATALLPICARDILHTGPWGLGILRRAPAAGALLMGPALARCPINRRVGMRMFQAVIIFGAATVVFAFSRSLWLSIVALAALGAADMVSMVIRIALAQLATPDAMRGRVGAVNYLFVNASYQLGEFESGITAALFGAVPAAALGGVGTIIVALIWMKLFPTLRAVERLE
jgi:hypothetical protein